MREAARAKGREAEARAAELTGARDAASARADAARARAEVLARDVETLQSERDGLAGRLASLEEMVATHSAFDEGVRALLARPEGVEVIGVVADALETGSEHERAVEAFLGDRLQAVLVPDAGQALVGIRWLQSQSAGRGAFLPLASARTRADCGPLREIAAEEPKALGLLSDFYRVSGPHAERIRASLPDAIVVATLEDALDVAARQGPVAVVTLEGETLRGAMVEGGRGVKGLLAPRREIKEVAGRQEQLEARLLAMRSEAAEALSVVTSAAAEARALDEQIHATEKELVAVRHEIQAADDEASRLHRKGVVLDAERAQAEQELRAATERLAETEQALAAAEIERAEGHRAARRARPCRGLRPRGGRGGPGAPRRGQERARGAARAHGCHRERLPAARGRPAGSRAAHRRRPRARRRDGDAPRRAGSGARRGGAAARRGAHRARPRRAARRPSPRSACARGVAGSRAASTGSRSGGASGTCCETRSARWRSSGPAPGRTSTTWRASASRAWVSPPRRPRRASADADKAQDEQTLAAQVAELREKLERMGEVNVLAVEQAQELEERHAFLTAQRQDLLDSIAELDQAIRKIDKASRERFQEAFQVINQHFGETFKQLFGGGTAGLSLLDEEDLLESGIDIMAQPPGKRLQNVMLLSGGEKALTAIALLFAIFQYKPSPFCILDEVDAPLDDANIGRFVKMLDGLKEQTQFVLITHSRKTMSIADQLYGVTMEEPGVSKLVSVRFT